MMTKQQVIGVCIDTLEEMRAEYVPRATGNMAFNALQYTVVGDVMMIGVVGHVAPYTPFTEYPWVSPRWQGRKNPNEGWWERFRLEFAKRISAKLGGEILYA